jgi:hypothetical protein
VALEATLTKHCADLQRFNDTLVALRLTVAEDKPMQGESALVDHLEEAILEAMGLLSDGLMYAHTARDASGHPVNLDRVRRALADSQERFHQIEELFSSDLASHDKLVDLASLGNERRGEWHPWANSVRHGLQQSREALDLASRALAACWQEIAERVGMTSVSVHTTNIGQKIVTTERDVAAIKGD